MPRDGTYLPPETQTDRDLAVLRAAREGIARPGGWCQGEMDKDDAHCAVGWLIHVSTDSLSQRAVDELIERTIHPAIPLSFRRTQGGAMTYNDTRRNQSTIVRWFDRAIARLESKSP
jgi:hypothetical protein